MLSSSKSEQTKNKPDNMDASHKTKNWYKWFNVIKFKNFIFRIQNSMPFREYQVTGKGHKESFWDASNVLFLHLGTDGCIKNWAVAYDVL